ncbi:hypothetical protein Agub_g13030 [Astrephomene gubernaculifera]|uniref:Uncharacterized protein n=1 Tax=Astrephomene gubernaculifera TaxID=47775 RepID=A0AAD3E0Q7_9CHLO|nr:hypothetical protein Agub_g13030 [Astrephomene gubernaculifera]
MGLFSKSKGQQAQGQQPQASRSSTVQQPATPMLEHPGGAFQQAPQHFSPAQYQQHLFHQQPQYQYLQPQPLQHPQSQHSIPSAQNTLPQQHMSPRKQPPSTSGAIAGSGSGGGATTGPATAAAAANNSRALLYQAVKQAADAGKPLTLDFVAQMQPVNSPINQPYGTVGTTPTTNDFILTANHHLQQPYGIHMPQQYNLQLVLDAAPQQQAANTRGGAPRVPPLPDLQGDSPAELQGFREQCAAGVRQAVGMVGALEHQLAWERARRQQAEEDCKVLLAAVHAERGLGEALQAGAEERRREAEAAAGGRLTLAAEELPQANDAATTIQKHVRGRLARKEFESQLRDILRAVDPQLDPAALPPAAQAHISHASTAAAATAGGSGGRGRVGLRAAPGLSGAEGPAAQAEVQAERYRREVERIGMRLAAHADAGLPGDAASSAAPDPLQGDVKQLLGGSYPASSAQVIATLVRRCRQLQGALLAAVGELQEAQLTIQGLKESNAKVSELSAVRADLEAARGDNVRLAATVARLQAVLAAASQQQQQQQAAENPYVAAWYRRAYADSEWQTVAPSPPAGRVAPMDGPDSRVEMWDELRAAVPEPVLVPRLAPPGSAPYRDLLALQQDLESTATQGPPDPLYTMPVPDRSAFRYERDTPLVALQSAAPLIREGALQLRTPLAQVPPSDTPRGPHTPPPPPPPAAAPSAPATTAAAAGGAPVGSHHSSPGDLLPSVEYPAAAPPAPPAHAAGEIQGLHGQPGSSSSSGLFYNRDTPVVPVYSVLPLIREEEYVRRSASPSGLPQAPPSPSPTQPYSPQPPSAAVPPPGTMHPQGPLPPSAVVAAAAAAVVVPLSGGAQ